MNPFQVLNISTSSSEAEIKASHRRLALLYHPDKAGPESKARFQIIQVAYEQALKICRSSWSAKSSLHATRTPPVSSTRWSSQAYRDFEQSRASHPQDRKWAGSFKRSYAPTPSSFRGTNTSADDGRRPQFPRSASHSAQNEPQRSTRRNAFSAASTNEPEIIADAEDHLYMRRNAFSAAGTNEPDTC